MHKQILILTILCLNFSIRSTVAEFDIVNHGKAQASIIIPDQKSWAAAEAAQELNYHIQKATGVKLPVLQESKAALDKTNIYIGDTKAAAKAGINISELMPNELVVKSSKGMLFLAGKEGEFKSNGTPVIPFERLRGSLWATYEFLQRYMKVKWLWPGDTGEVVPQMESISIPDTIFIDQKAPLLSARWGDNDMRRVKNPTLAQRSFI